MALTLALSMAIVSCAKTALRGLAPLHLFPVGSAEAASHDDSSFILKK